MNNAYTQKNNKYEQMLFDTCFSMEKYPGLIIGKYSLTAMHMFLGGYDYAFWHLTGYRLHFDKEFTEYIHKKYSDDSTMGWAGVLLKGRTEADAFDAFYKELRAFIELNDPDYTFTGEVWGAFRDQKN